MRRGRVRTSMVHGSAIATMRGSPGLLDTVRMCQRAERRDIHGGSDDEWDEEGGHSEADDEPACACQK